MTPQERAARREHWTRWMREQARRREANAAWFAECEWWQQQIELARLEEADIRSVQ